MYNESIMEKVKLDFNNVEVLRDVINNHAGECGCGHNQNGEETFCYVHNDHVEVRTYQSNHWVRENVYWLDGTIEELFNDKWTEEELAV